MTSAAARLLWTCGIAAVAVGLWAQPAHAGGSTWQFDAEQYQSGEQAFAWAAVAWEHSQTLGTSEDGPYFAYVVPATPDQSWLPIPEDAVRVAEIRIDLEPYDAGGVRYGPHHATIEFTVPDLPAGQYSVLHCNSPCTTTLGDITFGLLTVDASSSPPTASTFPATSDPTGADRAASSNRGVQPFAIGAVSIGLVAGAVGTAAGVRHRRSQNADSPHPASTTRG